MRWYDIFEEEYSKCAYYALGIRRYKRSVGFILKLKKVKIKFKKKEK